LLLLLVLLLLLLLVLLLVLPGCGAPVAAFAPFRRFLPPVLKPLLPNSRMKVSRWWSLGIAGVADGTVAGGTAASALMAVLVVPASAAALAAVSTSGGVVVIRLRCQRFWRRSSARSRSTDDREVWDCEDEEDEDDEEGEEDEDGASKRVEKERCWRCRCW
jgi:hypothetical protein